MCWRHGEPEEHVEGGKLTINRAQEQGETEESGSDLEAEETKECIDLGFVSTKEALNSELPEILPGHGNISPLGRREYICWKHGSFKVINGVEDQRKIQWI